MLSKNHARRYLASTFTGLAALALATSVAGCSDPELVEADADTVDRSTQALTLGDLESLNGTYGAGCTSRSGSWSLEIANGATLDHAALSVVKNDSTCQLTLTEIHAESVLYVTAQDIVLGSSYQGSASEFKPSTAADAGDPILFFANARMNPADFSDDFVLTFLFSDDPALASDSNNASHDAWEASVSGDPVSAPNYTYSDNLSVQTDASDIVTTVGGSLDLTDGSNTGEGYIVDLGTLSASPTYAQIEAAYDAGTPTSISGANPSVPVSAFSLMGQTLPVTRTLVIRHMESGVASFQTLRMTFNAP